jgi:ankyrin repeat protein
MLGETEKVAEFLEVDPSLSKAKGAHGISLIYHAALSGQTAIPELLLKQGDLEGMDAALHGATRFGHTKMLGWLLANGASDINVKNFEDKTPLQVAKDNNYQEIVDLLIQYEVEN